MQFVDSHAALATDRILLTRIHGSEISRLKPLGDAGLRQLDRGGSAQAAAARMAATLSGANVTAAFAIEDAGSGDIIGLTAVAALEPDEKRATLAPIWSSGRLDQVLLMSHVAHLMTRYAFEALAVERAEVHLDWRLRRTLELYTGLGFRCEGRLRAYFACDEGPSADAAVLSVVRSGWPAIVDRQRRLLADEAWRYRLPSDRPP
ncbi:GNAT family N-acetyltransferase [Bradyrhizobium acaciae]|uniref:GNAT family N-acetyltransferase n=1 Tax=Bradyrhizobium acaciae TaxID=2683706 RepID=UPI001E465FC0|nr:GNAT family protein [Bradyrhizobium acaciae]MCC8982619.1 GNAT family N-acetyltransferase [Bradyrhizobium acaciae]